jgi:hypothetical protein
MLQTLNPLNPDAPRIKGDAAAVAKSASTMYQNTGKIKVPTVMMIGQHDPVEPAGIVQRISDLYEEDFATAKAAAKKSAQKSGAYSAPVRKLQVLWATTPKAWSKFNADGTPISISGTPGTGHTNFSASHYKVFIDTMLSAATNGDLPWTGAHLTKVHKAKNLVIDRETSYPWMKYYNN